MVGGDEDPIYVTRNSIYPMVGTPQMWENPS
jgi:hypothetical protein